MEIIEVLSMLVKVTKTIGTYTLFTSNKIDEVDTIVISALNYFQRGLEKSPGNAVLLDYQAELRKFIGKIWLKKIEEYESSGTEFVNEDWRKAYRKSLNYLSYSLRIYRNLVISLGTDSSQNHKKIPKMFDSFKEFNELDINVTLKDPERISVSKMNSLNNIKEMLRRIEDSINKISNQDTQVLNKGNIFKNEKLAYEEALKLLNSNTHFVVVESDFFLLFKFKTKKKAFPFYLL